MARSLCALLIVCLACFTHAAPASAGLGDEQERFRIVATTGMVADIVAAVAGDRADVTPLMAPGVDPHLFQPTRADLRRLMQADLIFYNGLLLEGKMTDVLIRAATSGKPVYAVTEMLGEDALIETEGLFDPHVWMDPTSWASAVDAVREVMAGFDPDNAPEYRANAAAYLAELDVLDAYAEEVLATVPEPQRVLVTAHDAFGYFGRRFGFEVVGIQGISTESETGVHDIERIVGMLVEREIGAIFVESTVPERNVRAVIAGAAAQGHTVIVGGELFSDAMGNAGTYEGTYVGMIDHNVTTIAHALGGTAPDRGLHGRLSESQR